MFGFGKKVFTIDDSKGRTWHLNTQTVTLRNRNGQSVIYYFTLNKRRTGCDMPDGYRVITSPATGMPMLKKRR